MKYKYELRQIDAWADVGDGWTYNETWKLAEYETEATDEKRAFLYQLHKLGISCKRGKCVVISDGSLLELVDRKTFEPLFCAVPVNF